MESLGAGSEAAGEVGEWEVVLGNLVSIELKFCNSQPSTFVFEITCFGF